MTPVARIGDHMRAPGGCKTGPRYDPRTFDYILISMSATHCLSSSVCDANSLADGKMMNHFPS